MMSDIQTKPASRLLRKIVIPLIGGAVVGGLGTFVLLSWIETLLADRPDVSIVMAATVAGLYLIMGATVAIGTLNPRFGATFLNVEDADELREVRRMLLLSAAGMVLWGAALLALALAAPSGPLPGPVALLVGVGGLGAGSVLAFLAYRASDELMLAINLEAAAITYGLVLVLVGGWAIFAHLGEVAAPQPLDLLTSFYTLALLATFIAAGRRGMLAIR